MDNHFIARDTQQIQINELQTSKECENQDAQGSQILNFDDGTCHRLSKDTLHCSDYFSPRSEMAALFFLVSGNQTKDCLTLAKWHYLSFGDKPISTSPKQNKNQ